MSAFVPILLLAAGQSRRMGGADKLTQPVDGEPLLRRVARAACAAGIGPVFVALPPAPHPRHTALDGLELTRVAVPDAAEGMNASLRRAIAALPEQAEAAMIVLGDLPGLTAQDLRKVARAMREDPQSLIWRGATEDGKPGHPVVFARALFTELAALTGDSGAQDVIRRHQDRVSLVRLPGQRARLDLDTPDDWARWRAAQAAPGETT